MQPVSSVAAFIARSAARPIGDPVAAEIVQALDAEARLAVDAQALPAAERPAFLRAAGDHDWSDAMCAHIERLAFVALRRELQRRSMWLQ